MDTQISFSLCSRQKISKYSWTVLPCLYLFFSIIPGTALLGKEAAMACTVAVETVIVEHYNDQLRVLMEDPNIDKTILETITKFRNEEQEHHDTGIDHGAEQAPFYKALTDVIKFGCKTAIAISKKV